MTLFCRNSRKSECWKSKKLKLFWFGNWCQYHNFDKKIIYIRRSSTYENDYYNMPSLNFFPLFEVTRSTVPYGKVIQQSTAMGVHSPTFLCMKFDLFEFKYKIVSYLYSVPIYVRINVSFLVNIFENYCLELPSKARFFCFYSEVFSLNFFSMK